MKIYLTGFTGLLGFIFILCFHRRNKEYPIQISEWVKEGDSEKLGAVAAMW